MPHHSIGRIASMETPEAVTAPSLPRPAASSRPPGGTWPAWASRASQEPPSCRPRDRRAGRRCCLAEGLDLAGDLHGYAAGALDPLVAAIADREAERRNSQVASLDKSPNITASRRVSGRSSGNRRPVMSPGKPQPRRRQAAPRSRRPWQGLLP